MDTTDGNGKADVSRYHAALSSDPCSYCGGAATTRDHITATHRGGDDHWSNYTSACFRCNSSKGATTLLGFMLRRTTDQQYQELVDERALASLVGE